MTLACSQNPVLDLQNMIRICCAYGLKVGMFKDMNVMTAPPTAIQLLNLNGIHQLNPDDIVLFYMDEDGVTTLAVSVFDMTEMTRNYRECEEGDPGTFLRLANLMETAFRHRFVERSPHYISDAIH